MKPPLGRYTRNTVPLLDEPHYAQNLSMLSERAVFDTDILDEIGPIFLPRQGRLKALGARLLGCCRF